MQELHEPEYTPSWLSYHVESVALPVSMMTQCTAAVYSQPPWLVLACVRTPTIAPTYCTLLT